MSTRVMPDPDRYATCPDGGEVLAYYTGIFDSVYVSLSPFIRPVSISVDVFCPETYPSRRKVVEGCEAVTWREIMSLTNLPSLSAVDVGLRTMIGGLTEEYKNEVFSSVLSSLCDKEGVLPPPEGEHSDLLHNRVLGLFQELGYKWIWVGDEFCSERKLHWIEDLLTEEAETIHGRCNIFSPDKSLLWTVHWDSHFSFLCSSQENLDRINVASRLEGFFCDARTGVYWSVRDA